MGVRAWLDGHCRIHNEFQDSQFNFTICNKFNDNNRAKHCFLDVLYRLQHHQQPQQQQQNHGSMFQSSAASRSTPKSAPAAAMLKTSRSLDGDDEDESDDDDAVIDGRRRSSVVMSSRFQEQNAASAKAPSSSSGAAVQTAKISSTAATATASVVEKVVPRLAVKTQVSTQYLFSVSPPVGTSPSPIADHRGAMPKQLMEAGPPPCLRSSPSTVRGEGNNNNSIKSNVIVRPTAQKLAAAAAVDEQSDAGKENWTQVSPALSDVALSRGGEPGVGRDGGGKRAMEIDEQRATTRRHQWEVEARRRSAAEAPMDVDTVG